jgi:hypothetical protein
MFKDDFFKEFEDELNDLKKDIFPHHIPNYISDLIYNYIFEYFRRSECITNYESGIVICGFGTDENLPVSIEYIVDGRYKNSVRNWPGRTSDLQNQKRNTAEIIAFAQRDMTNLFMEGIAAPYLGYFFRIIDDILSKKTNEVLNVFNGTADEKRVEREIQKRVDQKLKSKIADDFAEFRSDKFIQPLMQNVQSLPREEMAAMAEALVELTSLRRKVDSTLQSVAGPVDVAFISKADGLIWMKRKHYFRAEKNQDFFERRKILEG